MITRSIRSSLAFSYWFPGEVSLTTEWAGELVAASLGLLLLRSTSESGEESRASFRLKKGCWRALPKLLIWKGSNLGDWASPKTADTVGDGIADNPTDCVVPLQVVLLPHATRSPLSHNKVELEIAGVGDPTRTSEVHLIGVVGVTRTWSNKAAHEIFVFGAGHDRFLAWQRGSLWSLTC